MSSGHWIIPIPASTLNRSPVRKSLLQRQCACGQHTGSGGECAECRQKREGTLQRASVNAAPVNEVPSIVHEVLRSPGQPLDPATRAFMEPRFGHDFSRVQTQTAAPQATQSPLIVGRVNDRFEQEANRLAETVLRTPSTGALDGSRPQGRYDFRQVRIHQDAKAAESARAVGALAYTVGRDIVFDHRQYSPGTTAGSRLLAHELTHVVQQNSPASVLHRFSTEDCDDADVDRIDESHDRAVALLEAAIGRLTADPVTAETQTHFANHFGGYGSTRRDIVVGHFRRDLSLLRDSEMTYQCESECEEGEPAYTYWIFGDIHICLPWLRSQVLTERGETFIHELHHWDGLRGHLDLGYHKNNQDNNTTWVVAVNNADAYSELAQDLYEQP